MTEGRTLNPGVGFRAGAIALLMLAAFAARPGSTAVQRSGVETAVEPLPSFSEPAISPDRSEIAMVSGGDIWTVGGSRRRSAPPRGARSG